MIGRASKSNDGGSFVATALISLTKVCGASLFVAVVLFPIMKAEGDVRILLTGYAVALLAAVIALILLRFDVAAAVSSLVARTRLNSVPTPLFIFALALTLRVVAIVLAPIEPAGDPAGHELAAWNVARGLGYTRSNGPDVHWPPGYVFFGSAFYYLFGRDWHILAVVNCVLDASTAVLVHHIAKSLFTPQQARLAGLIYALNPTMIMVSQTIVYTTLLAFLFCTILVPRDRPVVLGFLVGLMSLVKPIAVPLVAIFAIDQILAKADWKKVAATAGIVLAVATAIVSPWTIRNYLLFDRFVPVSANGGWVLWWGNNDRSRGLMEDWSEEQRHASGTDLIDLDRRLMRDSLAWIVENPLRFLNLVPIKQANTWGTEVATLPDLRQIGAIGEQSVRGIVQTYYLVLILLSGLAMIKHARFMFSSAHGRLICMMIMLIWGIHSIYIGWSIYRVFLLPFLSVIAVVALVREAPARRTAEPA